MISVGIKLNSINKPLSFQGTFIIKTGLSRIKLLSQVDINFYETLICFPPQTKYFFSKMKQSS